VVQKLIFYCHFFECLSRWVWQAFFMYFLRFEVHWEALFLPIVWENVDLYQEVSTHVFVYSTPFWLDFQGFGASEIEKKR